MISVAKKNKNSTSVHFFFPFFFLDGADVWVLAAGSPPELPLPPPAAIRVFSFGIISPSNASSWCPCWKGETPLIHMRVCILACIEKICVNGTEVPGRKIAVMSFL